MNRNRVNCEQVDRQQKGYQSLLIRIFEYIPVWIKADISFF